LVDDGGLSLLIPHLLTLDKYWRQLANVAKGITTVSAEDLLNNNPKTYSVTPKDFNVRLFCVSDSDIGDTATKTGKKNVEANTGDNQKNGENENKAETKVENENRRESSDDLWEKELRTLIEKFRLNINGPLTINSRRDDPKPETYCKFLQLLGYLPKKNCVDSDETRYVSPELFEDEEIKNALKLLEDSLFDEFDKVKRWLRVTELIHAYSKYQKCVFVTAPHPHSFGKKNTNIYLAVSELICQSVDQGAIVLIRGSGQNCLTFYSE